MQKPKLKTKNTKRKPSMFEEWHYIESMQSFVHNQKGVIPLKSYLSGRLSANVYKELENTGFFLEQFKVK